MTSTIEAVLFERLKYLWFVPPESKEYTMEPRCQAKIESDFDGTENRACNATRLIHFIRHAARTWRAIGFDPFTIWQFFDHFDAAGKRKAWRRRRWSTLFWPHALIKVRATMIHTVSCFSRRAESRRMLAKLLIVHLINVLGDATAEHRGISVT